MFSFFFFFFQYPLGPSPVLGNSYEGRQKASGRIRRQKGKDAIGSVLLEQSLVNLCVSTLFYRRDHHRGVTVGEERVR